MVKKMDYHNNGTKMIP